MANGSLKSMPEIPGLSAVSKIVTSRAKSPFRSVLRAHYRALGTSTLWMPSGIARLLRFPLRGQDGMSFCTFRHRITTLPSGLMEQKSFATEEASRHSRLSYVASHAPEKRQPLSCVHGIQRAAHKPAASRARVMAHTDASTRVPQESGRRSGWSPLASSR